MIKYKFTQIKHKIVDSKEVDECIVKVFSDLISLKEYISKINPYYSDLCFRIVSKNALNINSLDYKIPDSMVEIFEE